MSRYKKLIDLLDILEFVHRYLMDERCASGIFDGILECIEREMEEVKFKIEECGDEEATLQREEEERIERLFRRDVS